MSAHLPSSQGWMEMYLFGASPIVFQDSGHTCNLFKLLLKFNLAFILALLLMSH